MSSTALHRLGTILRSLTPLVALLLPGPANGQEPAAARLFREGQRLEAAADPTAALEEYTLLVRQFPGDALAPAALLRTAHVRRSLGDHAADTVARLLAEYPRAPEAASAYVYQADLHIARARDLTHLEEARAILRRVSLLFGRESYPALAARAEARARAGELARLLGELDVAAADFLAVIEEEPPSAWTGRAQLRLAEVELAGERTVSAAEILQRVASDQGLALPEDRGRARRLLTLLHRRRLWRGGDGPLWASARMLPAPQAGLRQPRGVAATEDGRLAVTDLRSEALIVLGPDGGLLDRLTAPKLERPSWDANGAFAVGPEGLRGPGRPTATFPDLRPGKEGSLDKLVAAERGLLGRWILLAGGFSGLLVYPDRSAGLEAKVAGDRADLRDLTRDPLGRLYVLDGRNNEVLRLSLGGALEGTVAKGDWKQAEAIALDALGFLFVLDRARGQIEVYDRRARHVRSLGPTLPGGLELRAPSDLTVDGEGRLFIADSKLAGVVVLE